MIIFYEMKGNEKSFLFYEEQRLGTCAYVGVHSVKNSLQVFKHSIKFVKMRAACATKIPKVEHDSLSSPRPLTFLAKKVATNTNNN